MQCAPDNNEFFQSIFGHRPPTSSTCMYTARTPALRPGTESHAESPFLELLLILSQQKIFHNFMHMRAKTICGFYT